ncbi:MAG: hypothetical protein DKT66_13815 [Candidatus Melainabacteria bacterium]|nr:MAG: hypothetical protein DKT66_13815 [Candidatus Melainabacteria bacterium]
MFDLDLLKDTIGLLLKGKLFRNNDFFLRQAFFGIVISAVLLVILVKLGVGLFASVFVASCVGGVLQPRLLKNLKFH